MHADPYVHVYSVYICIYLNLLLAIASRMSYVHVVVVLCPVLVESQSCARNMDLKLSEVQGSPIVA